MPDPAVFTLGAFVFDGDSGASIVGEIVITPPPRTINVAANCLASEPVQTTAFYSDLGTISFTAKLAGIQTQGESAVDHLARMWANLVTELQKDANTGTLRISDVTAPLTYRIRKNDDPAATVSGLTQSRSVMKFDVSLRYLP